MLGVECACNCLLKRLPCFRICARLLAAGLSQYQRPPTFSPTPLSIWFDIFLILCMTRGLLRPQPFHITSWGFLSSVNLPFYTVFSDTDSTGRWVEGGGPLALMGLGRGLVFCSASIDSQGGFLTSASWGEG